ncbi:MAG: hypothetical protein ACI8RD_009933 [Bacillariaceae sp.]|jgi:hypothetical protein
MFQHWQIMLMLLFEKAGKRTGKMLMKMGFLVASHHDVPCSASFYKV